MSVDTPAGPLHATARNEPGNSPVAVIQGKSVLFIPSHNFYGLKIIESSSIPQERLERDLSQLRTVFKIFFTAEHLELKRPLVTSASRLGTIHDDGTHRSFKFVLTSVEQTNRARHSYRLKNKQIRLERDLHLRAARR